MSDPDDDTVVHDDDVTPVRGPAAPGTAGDTLGGEGAPTGTDGSMGADAPSGDAGLAGDADPVTGDVGADPLSDADALTGEGLGEDLEQKQDDTEEDR